MSAFEYSLKEKVKVKVTKQNKLQDRFGCFGSWIAKMREGFAAGVIKLQDGF